MELIQKDKIKVYPVVQGGEVLVQKINLFRAKAGFPSPAMDYAVDSIDLNAMLVKNPTSTFLVDVDGDSMVEAFISDPATILIDRASAKFTFF